jgi:hypothetical protein
MSSPYPLYSGGPCQRCGAPLTPGKANCEKCGYSNPIQGAGPGYGTPGGASGTFSMPNGGYERSGRSLRDWSVPQAPTPQSNGYPAPPLPPAPGPENVYNTPLPYQQPSAAHLFNSGFIPTPYVTGQQSVPYATGSQPYITGQQPVPSGSLQNTPFSQQPSGAIGGTGSYQLGSHRSQQPSGVIGGMGSYQLGNHRKPSPPPAHKRGLSGRQIVGIFLLLAILLAGGLWEYRYITARDGPALGTSQLAVPTATPTPSTPPAFADAFADNTNAWNLQSVQGQFAVAVGGGNLSLENDNNKLLWELLPGGKTYDDFRLVVDAKLAKGSQNNGYGIYFRGKSNQSSDLATYYRLELYGDGSYALFKGIIDGAGKTGSMKLIGYIVDPAIQKQGGTNHIVLAAVGPKLTFSVNNQTLKTITDTSYASGTIALFVSNLEGSPPGAQAMFSNLAIYQA